MLFGDDIIAELICSSIFFSSSWNQLLFIFCGSKICYEVVVGFSLTKEKSQNLTISHLKTDFNHVFTHDHCSSFHGFVRSAGQLKLNTTSVCQ